jgi:hypothetical protein
MSSRNTEILIEHSRLVSRIAQSSVGPSDWEPIDFQAVVTLGVPVGCVATVEQATDLPSLAISDPENINFNAWAKGVITASSVKLVVSDTVVGGTHVRCRKISGTGDIVLTVRNQGLD